MPIVIDTRRIDDGDVTESTLNQHEAKSRESCRLMFNNTRLQRAQKRKGISEENLQIDVSTSSKFTRSSLDTEEGAVASGIECFICDGQAASALILEKQ